MAGRKKAAPKSAAKKAPAKKTVAAAKPKRAAAPKPGPRCIRNLLRVQQNLRLQGDRERPYTVTLKPYGTRGDTAWIPLACQGDSTFLIGLDRHFEIITKKEFDDLQGTYPPVGYQGRTPMLPNLKDGSLEPVHVTIIRPSETIRERVQEPSFNKMQHEQDSTHRERSHPQGGIQPGSVGPRVVTMPGGDGQMSGLMGGGEAQMGAAPPGGGDNKAINAQLNAQAAARRPKPKRS